MREQRETQQEQKHEGSTAKAFASLTNQPREPGLKGDGTMITQAEDAATGSAARDASRELDALIAEKVMGFTTSRSWASVGIDIAEIAPSDISVRTLPPYSTDIAAAWLVVEHTRKREWVWDIGSDGDTEWGVDVLMVGQIVGRATAPSVSASADTAPLAICRAALLAVGAA